jgi:TatD DNase family protein
MSPLKYFDVHTHLNLAETNLDWSAVGQRALSSGVYFLNVGTDLSTSELAVEQAKALGDGAYASVGLHPTIDEVEIDWLAFEKLAQEAKVLAIGECGLDYFHIKESAQRLSQVEIFRRQIELALRLGKPLMIHCRPSPGTFDAYLDAVKILTEYRQQVGEKLRFDMHFFVGDWALAQQFLVLGGYLSFTGVLTFTHDYDEVVSRMPLDRLLSETDAPYATPVPYRGKRNEPAYVAEVVSAIVRLRPEEAETIQVALVANAKQFFGLN